MTTIALDVMGGDHAPSATLSAAAHYSLHESCPTLLLVGDADVIHATLATVPHDRDRLRVVHAGQAVAMDADFDRQGDIPCAQDVIQRNTQTS